MATAQMPSMRMGDGGLRIVLLPTLEEVPSSPVSLSDMNQPRIDSSLEEEGEEEEEDDDDASYHEPSDNPAIPTHPIASMQSAFAESLDEVTNGPAVQKPDLRLLDAKARRERLLDQDRDDEPFDSTWRYRPGQSQHEVVKLIAQIAFGVYLLLNGMANDQTQVVDILQGHIDEVDQFLEVAFEDLAQATQDMNGRIDHLQLPMQNMKVFDELLEDSKYRAEILEGNKKIEHILARNNVAMKQWDDDIDAGLRCTTAFSSWLNTNKDPVLRADRPDLEDICLAMKHNAEGWLNAFDEMNSLTQEINGLTIRLMTIHAKMEKKVRDDTWGDIIPDHFPIPRASMLSPPLVPARSPARFSPSQASSRPTSVSTNGSRSPSILVASPAIQVAPPRLSLIPPTSSRPSTQASTSPRIASVVAAPMAASPVVVSPAVVSSPAVASPAIVLPAKDSPVVTSPTASAVLPPVAETVVPTVAQVAVPPFRPSFQRTASMQSRHSILSKHSRHSSNKSVSNSIRSASGPMIVRATEVREVDAESLLDLDELGDFPLPGSAPLLPPFLTDARGGLRKPASQPVLKIDTTDKIVITKDSPVKRNTDLRSSSSTHEEALYILQPSVYTPKPVETPMMTPLTPKLKATNTLAAQLEAQRQSTHSMLQKRVSLRQRVSLKTAPPEAIQIPPPLIDPDAMMRRPRTGDGTPLTGNSLRPDSAYESDSEHQNRQPYRVGSMNELSHPQRPTLFHSPHSEQHQFYHPVRASPHSPLQQRPHTAVPSESGYRASASYPSYDRNQPSRLGGMSMLSNVTMATDERATTPNSMVQTGEKQQLRKKRSTFGWLKKAFSLDEDEKAAFAARKATRYEGPHQYYEEASPKFLDGRRIR
jgi:hypothetical protein